MSDLYAPLDFKVEDVEECVANVTYYQHDTLTFCVMESVNGHYFTGESRPIDPNNYNEQRGREEARKKAFNKLFDAELYALRDCSYQYNLAVEALSDDE